MTTHKDTNDELDEIMDILAQASTIRVINEGKSWSDYVRGFKKGKSAQELAQAIESYCQSKCIEAVRASSRQDKRSQESGTQE